MKFNCSTQQVINVLKEWGGELIEPKYTEGISSTQIIDKLKERLVNNKLEDLEEEIRQNRKILVKLIDRWNVADTARDKRYDSLTQNAERRHEKLTDELGTQSESLNFLRGKLDKT